MSVRPLVLWVSRQGWTLRMGERTPEEVRGVIHTPQGERRFRYLRGPRVLHLDDQVIRLDPHGWEVDEQGQIVFRSRREDVE
ncbi:MAG: hypothetical protein D6775_07785 [Caldilineae bacterium]|nr:MAG: hypothetical protein D6775_07785 [Caldilineae bacterium]